MFNEIERLVMPDSGQYEKTEKEGIVLNANKIGLIGNIQGNSPALAAVLRDAQERGVTIFLNAGNSIGKGPFPDETVEMLADPRIISIKGRTEVEVLKEKAITKGEKSTDKKISSIIGPTSKVSVQRLKDLPEEVFIEVDGKKVQLTYARPSVVDEEGDPADQTRARDDRIIPDILVFGEGNRPHDEETLKTRHVNPGNVGLPNVNDPRASYVVWDVKEGTMDLTHVPYAAHELLDAALRIGLSPKIISGFMFGIDGRGEGITSDKKGGAERLLALEQVADKYGHLDEHTLFVRSMSKTLFNRLRSLHGLGKEDLFLLECAATLHDIGWAWGGKGHNKHSFDMIMMEPDMPLSESERSIVANIARYHRGPGPDKTHGNFAVLRKNEKKKVIILAAILRVADGMDVGHRQILKLKRCSVAEKTVRLKVDGKDQADAEIKAAMRKGDLFQEVFKKELRFE